MPSPVDICNLALGRIGNRGNIASIDPPERSVEAERCAKFYPIARDAVLEFPTNGWRFATTRATLAAHDLDPIGGWRFAYSLPRDCLKALAVLDALSCEGARPAGYVIETEPLTGDQVIYTNVEDAILRYTMRVEDSSRFAPLFVEALATWLGSYLAGAMIQGTTGMKIADGLMTKAQAQATKAAASDANSESSNAYRDHVPDSFRARTGEHLDTWPRY